MSEHSDQYIEDESRLSHAMAYAYDIGSRAVDFVADHAKELTAVVAASAAFAGPIAAQAATKEGGSSLPSADELAISRSNDVLEKYDLVNPDPQKVGRDELKDAGVAELCMANLTQAKWPNSSDRQTGLVARQAFRMKGNNTIEGSVSLRDFQMFTQDMSGKKDFSYSCEAVTSSTAEIRINGRSKSGKTVKIKPLKVTQEVNGQHVPLVKGMRNPAVGLTLPGWQGKYPEKNENLEKHKIVIKLPKKHPEVTSVTTLVKSAPIGKRSELSYSAKKLGIAKKKNTTKIKK